MDRFLTEEIEQRAPHAAAARREGAPALLRPRRRPRAHARGDRRHARRHPRAGAPAPRSRAQAAARGRGRPRAGELRGLSRTFLGTCRPPWHPASPPGTVSSRMSDAAASKPPAPSPMSAPGRPLLVGQMRRLGVDSVPDRALHRGLHRHRPLAPLLLHLHRRRPALLRGRAGREDRDDGAGPGAHRHGARRPGRAPASRPSSGTMKVTEQVDALETLAYDRYAYLVVPRVLAATLMFPVVTAFAMAVGVASGWITAVNLLDLSTPGVLQGAQAVLPVQGHLVRPGEERELRRRRGADGLPARPRREGRRRGRRASRPPARWCSAARRSWCWTRSGRWCCCEAGADAGPARTRRCVTA